jgi:hypothetical protein
LDFCGFTAGQQQVKVFGEAHAPHEIAAEVQPTDFNTIRIGLTDVAFCGPSFTDLHGSPIGNFGAGHHRGVLPFGKARGRLHFCILALT